MHIIDEEAGAKQVMTEQKGRTDRGQTDGHTGGQKEAEATERTNVSMPLAGRAAQTAMAGTAMQKQCNGTQRRTCIEVGRNLTNAAQQHRHTEAEATTSQHVKSIPPTNARDDICACGMPVVPLRSSAVPLIVVRLSVCSSVCLTLYPSRSDGKHP